MNNGYSVAEVIGKEDKLCFIDEFVHREHVKKLVKWIDVRSSDLLLRAAEVHGLEFSQKNRNFESIAEFGNWYLELLRQRFRDTGIEVDDNQLYKLAVILNNPREEKSEKKLEKLDFVSPEEVAEIDTRPFSRRNDFELVPELKDKIQVELNVGGDNISRENNEENDTVEDNEVNEDVLEGETESGEGFAEFSGDRYEDKFDQEELEYIYNLICHREGFRVSEIIPLAERFGKRFISELHTFIAADNVAVGIYNNAPVEHEFWFGREEFRFLDNTIRCRVNSLTEEGECRVELWELEKNKSLILKYSYDVFPGGGTANDTK
ncbi:MAG: hypothetical protein ACOC5A_03260 [Halanaerobiales bacterium]